MRLSIRSTLFATTACAAFASHALAQAPAPGTPRPPTLSLGGYYAVGIGGIDQDSGALQPGTGLRNHAIKQDAEIHFRGAAELDNGLRIGARIELEAGSGGDQIDESWVDFSGGYGRLVLGQFDGAQRETAFIAPAATGLFGVNTPVFSFAGNSAQAPYGNLGTVGQISTVLGVQGGDSEKIVYFTPNFSGFQLAFSYAPDAAEYNNTITADGESGTKPKNDPGGLEAIWQVAATFRNEWVRANIGYGWADYEAPGATGYRGLPPVNLDNRWAVTGGLIFTFAGFEFGGSAQFLHVNAGPNAFAVSDADDLTADLGVSYGWDAWKVGATYGYASYESLGYATGGKTRVDLLALTGSYRLGPGVEIGALVGGGRARYDLVGAVSRPDYDFLQVGLGTMLSF